MDLKQHIHVIRRWLWLIILCGALGGLTAFIVSKRITPTYQASTTLLVSQEASTGTASQNYDGLLGSQILSKIYANLMTKRPVIAAAITNLGLSIDPDQLLPRVMAVSDPIAPVLVLTVEDSDPQRVADLANEIANVFIQQTRESLSQRYATSKLKLEQDMAVVQADIDQTQQKIDGLKDASTAAQLSERKQLERILSQYRSSYGALIETYQIMRLAQPQIAERLQVISSAKPAQSPISPRILLNVLIASALAAAAAVGAGFLIESFDESLKSESDIRRVGGLAMLASVASMKPPDLNLPAMLNRRSAVADVFRQMRTTIESNGTALPCAILVTSSGPREGKSTVAINLAITIAQAGKCVILVDANLQHASLHTYFTNGEKPLACKNGNGYGLVTLLQQSAHHSPERDVIEVDDCLITTGVEHLSLLSNGPALPCAADLLTVDRATWLVGRLKDRADVIVFDSAALQSSSDAIPIARACDATILVVQMRVTQREALRYAYERLQTAHANVIGVVLNRTKRDRWRI
jgi:non-specific protein-tyrosine kinase